jgi:hypothetical protein
VHLADRRGERGRGDRPADPPARHRVRLGQRVDRDRPVLQPRHERGRQVLRGVEVVDVLVDRVDHEHDVPALAQLGEHRELLGPVDLARRVVGMAEEHRLDPGPERRPQLRLVERPVRLAHGHEPGHGAGQDRVGLVVLVPRLEQHNLVAGVEQRERDGDQRLGRPARHAELGLRVDLPSRIGPGRLRRDRRPELWGAERHRVLVVVGLDRRAGRLLELGRARVVREALPEVDRAVPGGEPERLPDHRLGEPRRLRARPRHPPSLSRTQSHAAALPAPPAPPASVPQVSAGRQQRFGPEVSDLKGST